MSPAQDQPGSAPASASRHRLTDISLDAKTLSSSSPDVEHERKVAIFDLLEANSFTLVDRDEGPYKLRLSIVEKRLVFETATEDDEPCATIILSMTPFRKIVRDYFMICESYFDAIKTAAPSRIEAIDMGRRGLHNEGSQVLKDRLDGKVELDFDTARRLFTLICVLHWKG